MPTILKRVLGDIETAGGLAWPRPLAPDFGAITEFEYDDDEIAESTSLRG